MVDGVELFAGGGGLAEGLRLVAPDLHVVGLEWDHAACRTRVANGHPTIRTDVATYPTKPFAGVRLVAAGPPCQPFSMSGKGEGRKHLGAIRDAAGMVADGLDPAEALARVADETLDFRTMLVLQPLRWVRDLRPASVLLEQVPPVLPVWEAIAVHLRRLGYIVWTGKVNAEEYGVPQTRPRALLLARLDGPVGKPPPTHRRYRHHLPDRGRYGAEGTLLGDGLEPWVSMEDVLGFGMTDRPSVAVVSRSTDASGKATGGVRPLDGGSGARATLAREREAGRWRMRAGTRSNATVRPQDDPAPTITAGHDASSRRWLRNNTSAHAAVRPQDDPAPTIFYGACVNDVAFVTDPGDAVEDGERVTLTEAAVLQSFDKDYLWKGNKSQRHQQVGNAVPPLLAAHAAAVVLGLPVPKLEAPR